MKYEIGTRTAKAVYDESERNPLIAALPEMMSSDEFNDAIAYFPVVPLESEVLTLTERKKRIQEIQKVFIPLNYMYQVYDQLWRLILGSYNTRTSKENVIRINKIFSGEEDLASYSVQPQSASLLGTPGLGKTSTIKRCLSLMPQVIEHEKYLGEPFFCKQILYLFCECPSDASTRTMCYNIVRAIDNAIGGNHIEYLMKMRSTATSSAITFIKVLCMTYNIGVIAIDEVQNLITEAKKAKRLKPLIKFLTELTNDTATAIYMSGTHDAESVFVKEEYLKRRTRGLRLGPFKNDGAYKDFLLKIWPYQFTKKSCPLTDKMANTIYDYSGGVPAYITKLFEESQTKALISGVNSIDEKQMRFVAQNLAIKPEKVSPTCNFISDFSASVSDDNVPQTPFEINILKEGEIRLFANARGRKIEKRDKCDLIEMSNAGSLMKSLNDLDMLEVIAC